MKMRFLAKKDLQLLKRALIYIKPYKVKFTIAFITMLSGVGLGVIQPLLWGKLLTSLFEKKYERVILSISYMVFLFLFDTLVGFYRNYLFSSLSQSIIYDIKNQMYKKILDLPVKAFDEMGVGEFMSRLGGDAVALANIITNQLLGVVLDIIRIIVVGVAIFRINIILALIVVAAFPISSIIFLAFGKKLREKNSQLARLNDQYFKKAGESIYGIREIKSLGVKKVTFDTFLKLGKNIKEKNIGMDVLNNLAQTLAQSSNFIAQCSVMATGGFFIFKGMLTMEYFIAFTSYSGQFSGSLMSITKLNASIQQVLTSLERIFGLLDNFSYAGETYGTKEVHDIAGRINFQDVHFEYSAGSLVLKKVSFQIEENRKVAFVGASGGGKTTIFNLLLRFYEPQTGLITVGDIDIRDFSENSLRSHIAVVRQDPVLFNGTIKENLLLASPAASDEELYDACRKSYIHDYIMGLPHQYETVIEENGVNFSGGQKQRIAIARAILKKSKIILFDEATSALDNESQYYIKSAIDELSRNHTVIIIAHRLLTVIEADEIFVLEDGEIVGKGRHETLIRHNEKYKNLYKMELDILSAKQQEVG